MNRIGAGNFSRRFVGVAKRPNAVATERGALAVFASDVERSGLNVGAKASGRTDALRKTDGEPKSGKSVASNGKFFDVESKTIVTIGKYEKDK